MENITLTGVTERDIDLLLVEEFMASPKFLSWFLYQLGLDAGGTLSGISHSVNTANGESDVEVDVLYAGGLVKVLIENKVDAPLQPRQAERYADRADQYLKDRTCSKAITVLAAPADYSGGNSDTAGFDKRISYESVVQWFTEAEELGNRRIYKQSLLTSAIERGSSGWTLVPNEKTTSFWQSYWSTAERFAKDLRMPKPTKKPATSSFIFFQPIGLDPNVKLIHKVPYGKVDLQFAALGDQLEAIENKYRAKLDHDMTIVKASKSGAIRINVPELNLQNKFSESRARKGLEAALRLLRLYRENRRPEGAT
jgi:hypothetical protein